MMRGKLCRAVIVIDCDVMAIVAVVVVVAVADPAVTAWWSGRLQLEARGKRWTHEWSSPELRHCIVRQAIVDDQAKDRCVAANPVLDRPGPVGPVLLCVVPYSATDNAKSDGFSYSVLIRNMFPRIKGIGCFLVDYNTQVPSVHTAHFVKLSHSHTVDTNLAL